MPTTKYWTGSQWVPIPGPPTGQVWTQPIGDGVATSFPVWHGLGTRNVIVAVYRNSAPYDEVEVDVERTDGNTVTIRTLPYVPTASEFIVAVASGGAQATLNITLDVWHVLGAAGEPALQNGWIPAGGDSPPSFRKYPDGRVAIKGLMTKSSGNFVANELVFTLPTGYRPPTPTRHTCRAQGATGAEVPNRVDVYADGTVRTVSGGAANPVQYATLDDIVFDTETVTQAASIGAMSLDRWHNLGDPGEPTFQVGAQYAGFTTVGFRKDPTGRVHLRGMFSGSIAAGATLFTLPAGYRPVNVALLDGINSAGASRVDIQPSGAVVMNGAAAAWASIDGLYFDTDSVNAYVTGVFPYLPVTMDTWHTVGASGEPAFQNGFSQYAGNEAIGFRRFPDGKVRLKGLIAAPALSSGATLTGFTLPVGYRPPGYVRYGITGSGGMYFVQLGPSGAIEFGGGMAGTATAAGWIDLSVIEFDTQTVTQVASSAAQPLDSVHFVGGAGEPAFQNSWVSYDAARTVRFRKFPDGRVRLAGAVKGGVVGNVVFTLPLGYRPPSGSAQDFMVTSAAAGNSGVVAVSDTGAVTVNAGHTTYTGLFGIEFDTESQSSYPSAFVQITAPPKVTSLPVAPVDGQEVYFVADAANGVQWHLRYDASLSGTSKWVLVGGPALEAQDLVQRTVSFGGSTWGAWSNTPSLVLPLAGDYDFESVAMVRNDTSACAFAMGLRINTTDPVLNVGDSVVGYIPISSASLTLAYAPRLTGRAASDTIVQRFWHNGTNPSTALCAGRTLRARPVRVG